MNGNNNDENYRYKIPSFQISIRGKGNGIYTVFDNIDEISNKINHPSEVILKYIASVTGSNYISNKNTVTGAHISKELNDIFLQYIKFLVMCKNCNIPETIPLIIGTKKNTTLKICCSACKYENNITSINKNIDKGVDIIIKYINSGNIWKTTKGINIPEFNPFS